MSEKRSCNECQATESSRFRPLKGEKWREAESKGLTKKTWWEGIILCNICYMSLVENPLKKGPKWKKVTEEEEVSMPRVKLNLSKVIKTMAKVLYEREYVQKENPIYDFDEMRELMEEIEPALKDFFEQLYIAARPSERSNQMIDRMKKIMLFICYLLFSLNNTKITAFKFDLAYYLDSAGTINEGLNTMANLDVTMTSRSIDRKKKQMSDAHKEYVKNALEHHSENAFVLNVDDYHNIHVQ